MGRRRITLLRVLVVVGVLAVLAIAAGVWMVWKRPLTVDAAMSRVALRRAGLEPRRLQGPAGRLTVWQGGVPEGPTLVLLHGAGDQAGAWARVAPPLAETYHLVIPDLPGHARSAPAEGVLHPGMMVEAVAAMLDQLDPPRPWILAGNSLGGWVAQLYALEHPGELERIVAVNGGGLIHRAEGVTLMPTDREQARRLMDALMGPGSLPLPEWVLDDVVRSAAAGPIGRFMAAGEALGPYVLEGRLAEIETPVELVWGDADELMPVSYAQRMAEELPAVRLSIVHGCGHVPQRECPDRFLAVLKDVLHQPAPVAEAPATEASAGEELTIDAPPPAAGEPAP